MTGGQIPGWVWPATFLPALAGLGVSAYLTYVHYTEPTSLSCPDTGVVNCTKVTTSPESMVFGVVPVALAGALFFAGMVVLTLPMVWRAHRPVIDAVRLIGAVAGVGMIVYLVYVEAVQVKALCLWCTAVHVLGFAMFVSVLAATLWRPLEEET